MSRSPSTFSNVHMVGHLCQDFPNEDELAMPRRFGTQLQDSNSEVASNRVLHHVQPESSLTSYCL